MDETTLVETYRETIGSLYRYVAARCGGDRGLAEDTVQETWLRAVQAWRLDGLPDHPLAWLKTVSRNLLLNYYRRAAPASLDALAEGFTPEALKDDGRGFSEGDAAVVSWGLARLRPGAARLIESFHLEGASVAEIAVEMGLSERAVEGRLRRARIELRKQLERVIGT